MATLTVWKFNSPDGAGQALTKLGELQKELLIEILDAATVSWPQGKNHPTTNTLHNLACAGALDGAFWGMLFGLIFFVPFFGALVGAALGALNGSFAQYGINEQFLGDVRKKVTPGTSALFLLTGKVVLDKVEAAMAGQMGELIRSNLSNDQEAQLRAAFAK
jgi:uncharacterized membrane protein